MKFQMTVRDSEDYTYVYGIMTFHSTQQYTKEDWERMNDAIDKAKEKEDWGLQDIVDELISAGFNVEYEELPDVFIRV